MTGWAGIFKLAWCVLHVALIPRIERQARWGASCYPGAKLDPRSGIVHTRVTGKMTRVRWFSKLTLRRTCLYCEQAHLWLKSAD